MSDLLRSDEIFFKNLEIFCLTHPKESIFLPNLDCSDTQCYQTKSGLWDIRFHKPSLYANENEISEFDKWTDTFSLDGVDVLYVYGAELGASYKVLKKWLHEKRSRSLVLLEDEPIFLYHFLHLSEATEILKDPQVSYYFLHDLSEKERRFLEMFWQHQDAVAAVVATPYSLKHRGDHYARIHEKINYDRAHKGDSLKEYMQFGANFYRNFYHNIYHLPQSYLAYKFFRQFKGVPAIICGAGPSLEKNIDQLSDLKEKALIFAGGSALQALEYCHIKPHFGVGIDPNKEQSERIKNLNESDYPYFYRNRLHYKVLDLWKGPKLYVSGSGGYDIAAWFESELGMEKFDEEMEEGHNVVNFSLGLAKEMGCSPIILIGCSLSFTDKLYAKGVKYSLSEVDEAVERVIKKDIHGKPIETLWKWVAEADWIAKFAKEKEAPPIYNASEEGLKIEGIDAFSLRDVERQFLTKKFPLENIINNILSEAKSHISHIQIKSVFQALEKSLKNCLKILDDLQAEVEKERTVEGGRVALLEHDLLDEKAFTAVLSVFSLTYNTLAEPKLYRMKREGVPVQEALVKLSLQKYQFLKNVIHVNLALLDEVLNPSCS